MIAVLKNFRPKELWVGLLPPSQALESVVATAQTLGVKVVRHWEGDHFNLGGATVSVLFPPRDWWVGPKPRIMTHWCCASAMVIHPCCWKGTHKSK
ncbi:MAG TPA: hypothetical protein VFE61_13010 [Candidatus Sulfotelmatobacter sp.]|nr:hypothetical protein [Candidatus Sulfotelmatobacter sp.]